MLEKIIKLIMIFLAICILLWGIIFGINFFRCMNYKAPILYLYKMSDEFSCTYKCLGYSIETAIYGMNDEMIIKTRFFLKKNKIFETDLLTIPLK